MVQTSGLVESFVGAIQASLSVLLVISYGGLAAWLGLLTPASTKAVSKVCVRIFLPALLFTKIGSELHAGSATNYLTVFIWAVLSHIVSFVVGLAAHVWLDMPDWTTVALMFNNSTSYPLLLLGALRETGILRSLVPDDGLVGAAVERASSYFLVFATVSSCLTFAVGPRLIDAEHGPDEHDEDNKPALPDYEDGGRLPDEPSENTGLLGGANAYPEEDDAYGGRRASFLASRRVSTAPVRQTLEVTRRRAWVLTRRRWDALGPRAKWWILFVCDFFNAPLLGAVLGAIVGLVPPLHRAFFNDTYEGGIFSAWLTQSLKNIGGLFVPLPVVVAGVSLFTAMRAARSQSSGDNEAAKLPWLTVAFIMLVRFVMWPLVSIPVIYALATRTQVLGTDPMLWFTMMLMPCGPPAMKLISLVQVSDADESEEMIISKLLTFSYLISPVLSFVVVASLRASEAAMG